MVKVAILGFGTVGSGVADILTDNRESIEQKIGNEIELKYILDIREFPGSRYEDKVVHDFSIIENDPEVSVVVETIGGTRVAYDFTKRALMAGKSVATSNKALVAKYGPELFEIAAAKGVDYLFEASVGGGIPIIQAINESLGANKLLEVYGILNGTTNYVLTKMENEGTSYETALKQAQELGYAELDPTDDVKGIDTGRKVAILASLITGKKVSVDDLFIKGIDSIEVQDIKIAREAGYSIKLLGRISFKEDGKFYAFVAPHLVPADNPIYNVKDVYNGIVVVGNALDDAMFYGKGAGKLPTASAVVSDVIHAVKSAGVQKTIAWKEDKNEGLLPQDEMVSRWYIRYQGIGESSGNHQVLEAPHDQTAFITTPITKKELRSFLKLMPQGTQTIRVL